jgi:hypothetical protein
MEADANIPPRYWASVMLTRWSNLGCGLAEVARKQIY